MTQSSAYNGGSTPPYSIADARRDLERYAQTQRLALRGIADQLRIVSLEHTGSYDVTVETFTEERTVAWVDRPSNEPLREGPRRGGKHSRWSVPVDAPEPFTSKTVRVPVPRTATVETCSTCDGRGSVPRCARCGGTGRCPCAACAHLPESEQAGCQACGGRGSRKCACPRSDGRQPCPVCRGTGSLHHYLELTVTWSNWVDARSVVQGEPPDALLAAPHAAQVLYEEEDRRLYTRLPGPARMDGGTRVNEAVHETINALLKDADRLLGVARVHRQRVVVRGVPIHHGRYRWEDEEGEFWVLGRGERVLAPGYPQSRRRALALLGLVAVGVALVAGAAGWLYRSELRAVFGWGA